MAVSGLLSAIFLLLFQVRSKMTLGHKEEDFFTACPPSNCGKGGLDVRYPFRVESSPSHCGAPGLVLSCWGNETLLSLPDWGSHKVIDIDYIESFITIRLEDPWSGCQLQNFSSASLTTTVYKPLVASASLVNCSKAWNYGSRTLREAYDVGPVSCLSSADHFVYLAEVDMPVVLLPSDCVVVSNNLVIPGWGTSVQRGEVMLQWDLPEIGDTCSDCEGAGGRCKFDWTINQASCSFSEQPGADPSNVNLIIGLSLGAFVVLVSVAFSLVYIFRKSDKEKEVRLKVEMFLATYRATKPTRYSFADVKKMTKHFKHKLGQGGFGTVYKGELPNGIPVAVKTLIKSKGEGEDFINEVATVGRIHHANVVRLLGFCSEGTWRALIYEFMPNESLEKYIFDKRNKTDHQPLDMQKLQEIAIGIAQGIEYLHQGCSQRILHFDIKPHNILLDHNFNPKISDFGLAKLCSRDQSIITMTAARGTMGYIAPEIYCRNFGTVSYKSDVYSFGMLVLEMVGGRKNVDPEIEKTSEIYFPEWIYGQIVQGHDLGLVMQRNGVEEDIAKKLAIIALWCIQWNPMDRPSMTKVIHMLMENLESLEIPPTPFVSSTGQKNGV
ncbi:rust resistance kinase Lr10-like isoform X2 [Elaeis guineensis]|uniref:rust resistance kinase Lr10-like isoform X2 n=1 Tax=Elaeis guineensis var. tenera TaxID=51953 RepID=UPI003C6D852C